MTRKDRSTITLQLMLVCLVTGAGAAIAVDGVWDQNPTKILVAGMFALLGGFFANVLENSLLDSLNKR